MPLTQSPWIVFRSNPTLRTVLGPSRNVFVRLLGSSRIILIHTLLELESHISSEHTTPSCCLSSLHDAVALKLIKISH